ncbi:hypothetical protein ERO13_A02G174600v2 [Gossypium hirsutum]|uniref:Uncharacterized protein At1g76070 n=2 Tax=Gossypium TaxID=3633 RepID=A0A1U8N3Y4_GOSHI|nr:uncharacterized protein At1g76070-like [Gossypium hirsutum]KAG4212571.1 hypothetical protein ERO13_A02G174600v2 [Gossypium hirsutum]
MVKPVKHRSKIILTFRLSPPVITGGKGISGHMVPLIPRNASFELREPVSPKVSCMGQIIKKKKIRSLKKLKQGSFSSSSSSSSSSRPSQAFAEQIKSKVLKRIKLCPNNHHTLIDDYEVSVVEEDDDDERSAPSLLQMRRFNNVRSTLSDFDWTTSEEKGVKRKRS